MNRQMTKPVIPAKAGIQFVIRPTAKLGFAACLAVSALTQAQDYPAKPVRLIVPSSPGGGTDATARILSPKLTEYLGQQVIVDNRPGAAAMVGSEFVARAAPDGYTLLVAQSARMVVPSLYRKIRFDPLKDLAPVTKLIVVPQMLVSHPSLPVKNLKEVMALARAKPGQLDYGAGAYGGNGHMSMVQFLLTTGLNINHIPYKSGNAGLVETLSGEVPLMMGNLMVVMPHVRAGKLRAHGVTSAKRAGAMPEIPTIAEAGVPGYESTQWFGVLAPTAPPRDIVQRLHRELTRMLADGDVRKRFQHDGGEPDGSASPEAFGAFLRADLEKWAKVVRAAGLKQQ
jgi:tripartite-type tricarboxylate transporter receptor subunit TctC